MAMTLDDCPACRQSSGFTGSHVAGMDELAMFYIDYLYEMADAAKRGRR